MSPAACIKNVVKLAQNVIQVANDSAELPDVDPPSIQGVDAGDLTFGARG